MSRTTSNNGWRDGLRRHGLWLLIVALVPLAFHFELVVQNHEPPAPDTQAVRPLLDWARGAEESLNGVPMWCPSIFSGMPSYGSFIYTPAGWHRPFDLLVRQFRDHRGLRYYLAMLLGGFSLYALGLRFGLHPLASCIASLLFVMTPYMMGVIQAGHSTKLRALYHVPLVFLALEEALRRPRLLAAAFLALSLALLGWTRHPQIAYYALLLGVIYAILRLIFLRPPAWTGSRWLVAGLLLVLAVALTGGMLLDPLASIREYTPHSVRGDPGIFAEAEDVAGGTTWDYATGWSFHPEELLSFAVPEWFGLEGATYWGKAPFTQSTHYVGVVALALAILGFAWVRSRWLWIWGGLFLVVLVIGFGRYLPILYRPMFEFLPSFNKFRVPSMIYSLLPLLLVPLVGETLRFVQGDGFAAKREPKKGKKPKKDVGAGRSAGEWILYATVLVAMLLIIWVAAGPGITDSMAGSSMDGTGYFVRADDAGRYGQQNVPIVMERRAEMFHVGVSRTLFLLTLLGIVLELRRRRIINGFWGVFLIGVLVVGNVWVVGKRFQKLEPKTTLERAYEPDSALRFLQAQEQPFRFLAADDPGSNLHAAFGLQSVMGYQPAKLRAYQDLIDGGCITSPGVLKMLQTRFLVSGNEIQVPGYEIAQAENRLVYESIDELPRGWLVKSVRSFNDPKGMLETMKSPNFDPYETAFVPSGSGIASGPRSGGSVELVSWSDELVELQVQVDNGGDGLLVLSEMFYPPGWRATVDGTPVSIGRVHHVLMGVDVPAGSHEIRFTVDAGARSYSLPVSAASTGLTILLLAIGCFLARRGRAGEGRAAPGARPE